MTKANCLRLENQICFPLYVCSKEIIKKYKPILDKYDLTYTQYITMMVLLEKRKINVKELGNYLFLDSGTLTPLLKKLENKGYIKRTRSLEDERNLVIEISKKGEELKNELFGVPEQMCKCVNLNKEEIDILSNLLNKMLKEK